MGFDPCPLSQSGEQDDHGISCLCCKQEADNFDLA
jgi:hypothetical protein